MEPTDLYGKIQPLVQQDIKEIVTTMLEADKYDFSPVAAHTHNGPDSPQFPFANLVDANQYLAIQTVTLSTTQVKALFTTPITIVLQPIINNLYGSSTPISVLIVTNITARLVYGGTAYAGANALEFRYTGAAGAKVTADISTTFLNAATSKYAHVAGVTTELVPVANSPIVVCVPTANPTTGNSPIIFTVHYRVVSFNQ